MGEIANQFGRISKPKQTKLMSNFACFALYKLLLGLLLWHKSLANKRLIRSPFIARSFPTGNAFKAKRRKNAQPYYPT